MQAELDNMIKKQAETAEEIKIAEAGIEPRQRPGPAGLHDPVGARSAVSKNRSGPPPALWGATVDARFPSRANVPQHVHAKMYVTINALAVASCLVGKSDMFRKESLGGVEAFGKYLREDNAIGDAIWAKGLRHRMTNDLAYQTLGSLTVLDYLKRRARWIRIRKYTVTAATLTEPFTESILNGVLAAWGFSQLLEVPALTLVPFHFAVWLASDWTIASTLDQGTKDRGLWRSWRLGAYERHMALSGHLLPWHDEAVKLPHAARGLPVLENAVQTLTAVEVGRSKSRELTRRSLSNLVEDIAVSKACVKTRERRKTQNVDFPYALPPLAGCLARKRRKLADPEDE
ncbi:hypothetical protein PhCBS80983_g01473 [Powellomyces hirtus]|uniref:Uncharacterized protein n=1 Tax=Powellomyces hirtus TaxID=109895 RepID=A0A507EAQ7_9FUNG|nr:hypothetical protein PhCBS80983_g01473 [Powellomyces hirtus]